MNHNIYINVSGFLTRIALMENGRLAELHIESVEKQRMVGNIYLGRVTNVLPGMHAAFVDIGLERDAFLYVQDAIGLSHMADAALEEMEDSDISESVPQLAHTLNIPINQILQPGQTILVQNTREPMEMKGARISAHINLPGRYLVLMTTVKHSGISKRIESETERKRLKEIMDEICPPEYGVIIRTVAEGKEREDLEKDIKYLVNLWKDIQLKTKKARAPSLLHQDLDPVTRAIRDLFDNSVNNVLIDSVSEYTRCRTFIDTFAPHLTDRITYYQDSEPLFEKVGIETELNTALKRVVKLPSGGYLVFDQTEALVAIDVNTGRFVGKHNLEETVLKTNLEAAKVIGEQVRLRDLSGIIVIDFIDMEMPENRIRVSDALQLAFSADRSKVNISEFSTLGLVEMTRKRMKRSLPRTLLQTCPNCYGSGLVKHPLTVSVNLFQDLVKLPMKQNARGLKITAHPSLEQYLVAMLKQISADYNKAGKDLVIEYDDGIHTGKYEIAWLE